MTANFSKALLSTASFAIEATCMFIHVEGGKAEINLNLFETIPCTQNMQQQQF